MSTISEPAPLIDAAGATSKYIVFRSAGGRTTFSNETAVCEACHALIHEGLLRVTGDPQGGLSWSTAADLLGLDSLGLDTKKENEFLTRMPVIESTAVDSHPPRTDNDVAPALVRGLVRLGYSKAEAQERIAGAIRTLMVEGIEITEREILQRALCPHGR